MTKELTCIICPRGCQLKAETDGKRVLSVTGYFCPRGKKYAEDECTAPMRTVTSTVKTSPCGVISVKTSRPIPKDKVFDCMKLINDAVVILPVSSGDVIIKDVFGADIIATESKEK